MFVLQEQYQIQKKHLMKDWKIIKVNECPSTNSLMKEKKKEGELSDKTAIMTDFQSSGRGQGKNVWYSDRGKNLLASFYRKTDLKADKHFMLTIMASLAIMDTLKEGGISSKIKWPNDIYVENRKIAGILIENSLMQSQIHDTIVGIGLNINQIEFPEIIPNPVSIAHVIQKEIEINNILETFIDKFDSFYNRTQNGDGEELFHEYNENLFRLKEWKIFEYQEHNFNGQIRGVMPDGRLIVETESGALKHFLFGEVKYVI